jgi:hypothetical protein
VDQEAKDYGADALAGLIIRTHERFCAQGFRGIADHMIKYLYDCMDRALLDIKAQVQAQTQTPNRAPKKSGRPRHRPKRG